jgi:hypothetical protein
MIIPDQFVCSVIPATRQLLNEAESEARAVWSSLVEVARNQLMFFPGARAFSLSNRSENTWKIKGFGDVSENSGEKLLLGFGRTFFPAGALDFFSDRYINPVSGEVDLLLTFEALFENFPNYAVLINGRPLDLGTWLGYEHFVPSMLISGRDGNFS